jgi:hypothetical protein
MLNRKEYPFLIETLCAILMILPQGKIANIVKNRLEISKITISNSTSTRDMKKVMTEETESENRSQLSSAAVEKLLVEYLECQQKFFLPK